MGARERRGTAHSLKPFGIRVRADLGGRLLRRYKRFLADVETDTGEKLTVHCPDPGSLRGTARPGVRVRCSTSRSVVSSSSWPASQKIRRTRRSPS